jgi:hypothetical protein
MVREHYFSFGGNFMKTRAAKILAIFTISIAILLLGGLYFVDKVFNLIITSQINELGINEELEKVSVDNFVSSSSAKKVQQQEVNDNKCEDSNNSNKTIEPSNRQEGNADTTNEEDKGTSNEKSVEKTIETTREATRETTNEDSEKTTGEDSVITNKNIKELEEKVTFSDKTKALQIVSSRLKAEDISILRRMVKNGITSDEIESAKEILKSRITKEEKEFLKELVNKYEVLP